MYQNLFLYSFLNKLTIFSIFTQFYPKIPSTKHFFVSLLAAVTLKTLTYLFTGNLINYIEI